MKMFGIEVKLIIIIDGSYEVNEVFLIDVKVFVENLIGEENMGWIYVKFFLGYECSGIVGVVRFKCNIDCLKEIVWLEFVDGE